MSNGFLSQEEIDSLLNGGAEGDSSAPKEEEFLEDIEKDLLGEIGNISMGSASTALSQIINQQVNITTPVVSVTTLKDIKSSFEIPNIALEVEYITGIVGINLLVMKTVDASIIASLMMGGNGEVTNTDLSEIEISAVSEAMNQMIGSAATSMATMFSREVNISPPTSKIWKNSQDSLTDHIQEDEPVVKVSFKLTVGELIDSSIMQVLRLQTAKKIVSIMMGGENESPEEAIQKKTIENEVAPKEPVVSEPLVPSKTTVTYTREPEAQKPKVEVQEASFPSLSQEKQGPLPKNIDLILDVPLDISVVLGKSKKSIKDILNLGSGSLIELDRLAEEPVEILVNGKKIAYGEVVVVDENFGVRITSIVSNSERVKTLGQ